jgi:hypothetical protein
LAELENFKVWSGRPEPAVVSGTGDGTDIDTRTRIGAEALLLALGRLSQLPEPPLVFFYATYPPPRFFTKYHRNNMREWAKFWSDYDAPKVGRARVPAPALRGARRAPRRQGRGARRRRAHLPGGRQARHGPRPRGRFQGRHRRRALRRLGRALWGGAA